MKIESIIKSTPATRSKAVRSGTPMLEPLIDSGIIRDEVKLTSTAEKMSQLEGNLTSVDVSDRAKIESIRQEIAEGRFKIDADAVAESLVQETIANISRHASKYND